jgi:hypothetical protein
MVGLVVSKQALSPLARILRQAYSEDYDLLSSEGTHEGAMKEVLRWTSREEIAAAVAELDLLLNRGLEDLELLQVAKNWRVNYVLTEQSVRGWLCETCTLLRFALQQS